MGIYERLLRSDSGLMRRIRQCRRVISNFAIPAPRLIFLPILVLVLSLRYLWFVCYRVFVCEPLFKTYCHSYGKNVHTDVYLHWVQGRGKIIVGNDVLFDGKCSFNFGSRFHESPTLIIGNNSAIGHGCSFVVAKRVEIGDNCRIASDVLLFDSPGHPLDPIKRQAGLPPEPHTVKEIRISDNVWLGTGSIVFPGVSIGKNSVVSAGSVVTVDVPPNVVVAGNPARRICSLETLNQDKDCT